MGSTVGAPQDVIPARLLHGQKALVTGASSGIGKATAIGLGRAGADVVVNYVSDREAAEEVVQEITSFGVRTAAYEADVSQELAPEKIRVNAVAWARSGRRSTVPPGRRPRHRRTSCGSFRTTGSAIPSTSRTPSSRSLPTSWTTWWEPPCT